MANEPETNEVPARDNFIKLAGERPPGIIREQFEFLRRSKKWFLLPILLALAVAGALVVVGGTVAAPFIYAVF